VEFGWIAGLIPGQPDTIVLISEASAGILCGDTMSAILLTF
jgi:hypothetical protein